MKKYKGFINEEVGLRNLKNILKGYKNAEIYFHKDLDGVTSALAMKGYLKTYYNIDVVDAHEIQYGGLEWAITNSQPGNLSILVDFAHAKPMFHIATDHHDSQVGDEDTEATYFKSARSNVETISGEISHADQFTQQDIELIKTIDSADFYAKGLKPEDIQNSVFSLDKKISKPSNGNEISLNTAEKNRFMMGLVVNRLLLAHKNKRISVVSMDGKREHNNKIILECMVLDCTPSLISMYTTLKHYIESAVTKGRGGKGTAKLATPEEVAKNLADYIERQKGNAQSGYDAKSGIIVQYGGGSMFKPGSYDRYVPFKNNPDANFICIIWPMGLIQMSCNPFKEKELNVHLGDVAREVMANHERTLKIIAIRLDQVKYEYEETQDLKKLKSEDKDTHDAVGFKFSDLEAFYGDCVWRKNIVGGRTTWKKEDFKEEDFKEAMNMPYSELDKPENADKKKILSMRSISIWELISRNSGGHPSITNLTGFGFFKYNKRACKVSYGVDNYTLVMKKIAREMVNALKEKIAQERANKKVTYDVGNVEFTGTDTNESYNFFVIDKQGNEQKVNQDQFVELGSKNAMKSKSMDIKKKTDGKIHKVVAQFETFRKKN